MLRVCREGERMISFVTHNNILSAYRDGTFDLLFHVFDEPSQQIPYFHIIFDSDFVTNLYLYGFSGGKNGMYLL